MLKTKHRLPIKGSTFIVVISFIYSLANTLIIPVFPIFVKNLVNNEAYAGYFMALINFLILLYILLSTYFLKNFDKLKILKFSMLGSAITFVLLSFIKSSTQLLVLELFRAMFIALNFVVIGLLIRDTSTKKTISSNEGFYFAIINVSFFIGPLIGGLLADAYSFKQVFLIASIFPAVVFLLIFQKRDNVKPVIDVTETKIFDNVKEFLRNKNAAINYAVSIGLIAWLVILYIYVPLYLNKQGINEKIIGMFLALTVVPLILLEVPVTKLIKRVGYKKLFFLGFGLIALFGISTFFTNNIYIKLLLFILTNLGVAFVEPLKESYFFEVNKRSNEIRYYPIFKTSSDIGHLVGPLIFSSVLLLTNFDVMFLVAGFLMLGFAFLSLSLKEIR